MSHIAKLVVGVLSVLLFTSVVFAQVELEETADNNLFAVDYPSGWLLDGFLSEDPGGELRPVMYLYSSDDVQQVLSGAGDSVLPAGGAVVYVTSYQDGSITLEEAIEESITEQEERGGEAGRISDIETLYYEGFIAPLTTDLGEGYLGVLGSRKLRITVITLAADGDLTEFEETFEAMIDTIRPSKSNADTDAGDEDEGESDNDGSAMLTYGMSVTGLLMNRSGDEWTFEGQEGDVISILMSSLALDSYLELYDPNGDLIEEDDDSGGGLQALIEGVELEMDGTYTIVARTFAGQRRGEYTLILIEGEEFSGLPAGTIEIGDTIEGTLPPGTEQIYTFMGNAGDEVTIELDSDDLTMDPYVELRSPDGDLLAEDDDSGGGLNARIDDFDLPEDGEYQIVVRTSLGAGGGEYTLTLR